MYFKPSPYGPKSNVARSFWKQWDRTTTNLSVNWSHMIMTRALMCHCCKSFSSSVPHSFSSAPLQPCDPLLPFAVSKRSRPSTSALTAMVMPSLKLPHCSPGSTDIVLLPVYSNSFGLLGPVRKAFLHRAPQVPANGSLGRRCHVMVCSQCQTPTTAHFLEGKYIQRAWMFLFLISLAEKEEQSNHFWNNALI